MRGLIKASISPDSSILASVWWDSIPVRLTPFGATGVWTTRPGCSRLPWSQVMSSGATP